MAQSNPNQTTVIFVPGAWHSPECFESVGKCLNDAGYGTDYVHLPSTGPETRLSNMEADVARIRSHITPAVESGRDVVMVMHSYGGVPTQDAVKGLDKMSQSQQGKTGGVYHLIFCCSFVIDEGHSVMSAFGNADPPWCRRSDDGAQTMPDDPATLFYNDLDDAQAELVASKLRPHSAEVANGKVQYAAWRHVPSTYIYCLKDQALPIAMQKMMVEQTAGKVGIEFQTQTLDSSHSPFLSMPEETSKAIRRAAGEQI